MKNILITGASQGIGKATAIEAAKAKMFVGINYNQNSKAADECLAEVKSAGGDGISLKYLFNLNCGNNTLKIVKTKILKYNDTD